MYSGEYDACDVTSIPKVVVRHIFQACPVWIYTQIVIINALVFSKLYYCSSVWANTSKKNIAKLQTVQNFAAYTNCHRHEKV